MPEASVTITGNLTEDATLRFTPSGAAVANVSIASTPRSYDKSTQQWIDGETLYMRGSIWKDAAENVAESLTKGTRVIAVGRLKQRSFESKGEKRTVVEMDIEEIGPSLRYATAKVSKAGKSSSNISPADAWGGASTEAPF